MGAIAPTKKQMGIMIDALDQDYLDIEAAARAAFDAALSIFEERAQFVVVGQVIETKDKGRLTPEDVDAVKASLGWYDTKGKAQSAAESWTSSAASGDRLAVWVLPVFHGSPADWHKERRESLSEAAQKRAEKDRAAFLASIEQHQQKMLERAEEYRRDPTL